MSVRESVDRLHGHLGVSLKDLAGCHNVSREYLSRVFLRHTGTSFASYALSLRMRRAAYLLSGGDEPVTDIAASLGYANSISFITQFRRTYGTTPRLYRANSER
jgi:AraC-like DNA-binding protein